MVRIVILTVVPPIFVYLFCSVGFIMRYSTRILYKEPLRRSDEMVFGHHMILYSLVSLFFLGLFLDRDKLCIPYISTSIVPLFFTTTMMILLVFWIFSIFYLKSLSSRGKKSNIGRYIINFLGAWSMFAFFLVLAGIQRSIG
jgi:prepilin signal peptidase PulO-like enzyme (type II secretory pathway)